jgi:transcription termination factor Rho
MSEPQLERSVLEAKERDELLAIADALGTKPGSRAKKADLIAQILRATGVETDASEPVEKPRRTRARKSAATQDVDGGAGSPAGGTVEGAVEAERSSAAVPAAGARPGGGPAAGNGANAESGDDRPERDAGRPADASGRTAGEQTAGNQRAGDTAPAPGSNGSGAGDGGPGDPRGAGTAGELPATADQRSLRGDGSDRRRDPSAERAPEVAGPAAGASGPETPASHGAAGQASPDVRPAQPQGTPDGRGQPPQPAHGATADRQRFDSDPGNRRNRRRRGRDRGDRMERDLQSQSPEQQQYSGEPIPVSGLLDLRDEGYGFLRTKGFLASPNDVYVSISQVRRFALRKGDEVDGACRPAAANEKYPALLRIDTVSGLTPDEARQRLKFEDLTPLFPDEKMRLEVPGDPANMTARIVDLISPIGKGQRGLIVSPPKAGKTTVLKQIAHSIEANNPEVHLMVLLVDERPEEVTDMRRSVNGEVIASTFDRPSDEHTQVAELAIERAKRLVELGRDVVIVLDGITRLARAYNLAQPATGRIMSGGIDTGALYPPKKFFGSARNIEEGGSLTILATALVETGSRMDEVIFEEFKGTGNMELRLDRKLSERRIYPALDVNASSTRHEELLFDRTQLQQVWKLRRVLNALGSEGSEAAGLQLLMDKIKTTRSNDEFLAEIAKTPAPAM